jgi:hypothetical protein
MDSIMENNLKTFAKWFIQQQEEYAENLSYINKLQEASEAAWKLIELARMLIYDTDLPDSEKLEKIWNAINIFYDKYWDPNL